jgi:hypothetical protein
MGDAHAQYLDFASAATTPERCLSAIESASRLRPSGPGASGPPKTARAAFDALTTFFDRATTTDGGPATFLIDEILDARTFAHFPGLRHVLREIQSRLNASPARFVLASRFTARVHRWLRDASARFEVIHLTPMTPAEIELLAAGFETLSPDTVHVHVAAVAALAAGRPAYVQILLEAIAASNPRADPAATFASLLSPGGRLTARCRESYEFRLHRARGYGALKAILGILAEQEGLNLTEIAQRLNRTPGSTKDYLSWLEDVDVLTMQGKRYSFEDPLLRLFVRLHAGPVPPGDSEVVREVRQFAERRLPPSQVESLRAAAASAAAADADRLSGIIEID